MTEPFMLPSLALGTALDVPVQPLNIPGELTSRAGKAMYVLDGVNRAPRRLARIARPAGLMGVKLANPGARIRITLQLLVDEVSTRMWHQHHVGLVGGRVDPDDPLPDVSRQHRLVEISVQGRPRGVLMLSLRQRDAESVRQQFRLELDPDEIDEGGLVMIGFEQPENPPVWMQQDLMADGPVGLCVVRLQVEPLGRPVRPHISSGRPPEKGHAVVEGRGGGFVINPPDATTTLVSMRPYLGAEGTRLRGRRARVRHPVRAARQERDDRRAAAQDAARFDAVDLQGNVVLSHMQLKSQGGAFTVELPPGTGPVFARAVAAEGRRTTWKPGWKVRAVSSP